MVYSQNFTFYVNKLFNISKTLDLVMFEDDTNFFADKNVTALFQKANFEQKKFANGSKPTNFR